MVLACQNISKSYGITEILNNINFHIEAKDKLAIVGINGAGKSTLLKIIMNEEEADEGQVIIGKDVTIGYLAQHQDSYYDKTIYEELLSVKQNVITLQEQMRELEQNMKNILSFQSKILKMLSLMVIILFLRDLLRLMELHL